MSKGPRILAFDIETAPIQAYTWGLYDQNIGINQIKSDWHLLSFAAKFIGEKKVYYCDQRNMSPLDNDRILSATLGELINKADIILTQNGRSFDMKKINARLIINELPPCKKIPHIDTKVLAKKEFGFTSNSLEYLSKALNLKYKKLKHKRYAGFELWSECLKGNKKAWNEMKRYNIHDVLALEELYKKLAPWGTGVNFSTYYRYPNSACSCGSTEFYLNGYFYSASGKYQRYRCKKCSAEGKGKENLLSKQHRANMIVGR